MSAAQWFGLGMMVALTPSLLVLAILLLPQKGKGEKR